MFIDKSKTSAERMKEMLPDMYVSSRIMDQIMQAEGSETDKVFDNLDDILNQFFVETATWGLRYHEEPLSIPVDEEESYKTRRARIIAKKNRIRTFRREDALNLADTYSTNSISDVLFRPTEYSFKTTYHIDDLVDYKSMMQSFEELKPAHLKHVLGLVIDIGMEESMTSKERLQLNVSQSFAPELEKKLTIESRASMLGVSKFTPETVERLYMDGSFLLDGDILLDGQAPGGIDHYVQQSDSLYVKVYENEELTGEFEH